MRSLLAVLAALLLLPATAAQAVETAGLGADVEHVRNLPYPDSPSADGDENAGTDLELATVTIPNARRISPPRGKRVTDVSKRPGLQRTFAFAGSYSDGLQVVDVSDPAKSEIVATWDCGISQGDVQVFQRKDLGGRWFVTYTHDDGYDFFADSACAREAVAAGFSPSDLDGAGTFIAEVTDPYAPKLVSYVPIEQGSHNMTVHPSGKVLYNSNSDLITSFAPAVEIIDVADVAAPRKAGEVALLTVPGLGTESHDISFSPDGTRAYVAALSHGEVLDTTDPLAPTRVGAIVDPAVNVWHQAEAVELEDPVLGKRKFLIAEDEFAGALGTGQCPNGGVHVYDVTGDLERAPVKVGFWNIDEVRTTEDSVIGTCTAHVFQLHPEAQLMTIAFYNGGVRVVDLSGLVGVALGRNGVGMKEVGSFRFPDSNTWAVKASKASRKGFHLFGNDQNRGFDVYRYRPALEGTADRGTWLTPAQIRRRVAQRKVATGGRVRPAALCLLR
jgi:hypothetical protein